MSDIPENIPERFQILIGNVLTHVKTASKDQVVDILTEGAFDELAEHAAREEAMQRLVESIKGVKIQFAFLGVVAGAAAGGMAAFALAYRKAEAKFAEVAEAEIEEMQQHYDAKKAALDVEAAKRPISEIVAERGYISSEAEVSSPPPMAVAPPSSVVEAAEEDEDEQEVTNVFEEVKPDHEWDWETEKRQRRPHKAYVVHIDEKDELGDYADVTLTYYEGDDVLCDERDVIVDPEDRDNLVGEANLERFGHGSGDVNVVYIRNDRLEILYEIVKSPNEYAVEVHGFNSGDLTHEDGRRHIRRMREQERDEY